MLATSRGKVIRRVTLHVSLVTGVKGKIEPGPHPQGVRMYGGNVLDRFADG